MLPCPFDEVTGHADIQSAIAPTGQNVDHGLLVHGCLSLLDSLFRGNDVMLGMWFLAHSEAFSTRSKRVFENLGPSHASEASSENGKHRKIPPRPTCGKPQAGFASTPVAAGGRKTPVT